MHIYFSGIGGSGIGPLAEMALDASYQVSGSDLEPSAMTRQLQTRQVLISFSQDGSFLSEIHRQKPIDWLIYTAALPADHPELLTAQKLGIKTFKRDYFINHLAKAHNLKLVGVAGTHGKTTTTAMLVWAFKQLNLPLSYFVGSTISFGPSGLFDPASQYFVYECDEYNRNFLHFQPYLALITSLDYDHPDTYPTKKDYLNAFHQFASQCQTVISWRDQQADTFQDLANLIFLEEPNHQIRIAGEHNRRNATIAQATLAQLGINDTTKILTEFPGTSRRFEKLATNLYTDYAHHPTEIQASLQLAGELSKDIVVVYQPHQNIRQLEIKDQYTRQFDLAKKIYWLPTYEPKSREIDISKIPSPQELTKNLSNQNIEFVEINEELLEIIKKALQNNQLVVCMSAGSLDAWLRNNLQAITAIN